MIFSELYSAYYHTVAEILKHATDHAVGKEELRTIIKEIAGSELCRTFMPGRDVRLAQQ